MTIKATLKYGHSIIIDGIVRQKTGSENPKFIH